VSAAESERELTSTLNLGLRSIETPGAISAAESFLQRSDSSVKAMINEICTPDSRRAMLIIHRGPAQGSRFLLDNDEITIGRSPESDVFLDDVTVSRKHAYIVRNATEFSITDSHSLNGTYVNSISISSQTLHMGDELQIGKFHALFFGNSHIKSLGEK
jgi:hypothetical protein